MKPPQPPKETYQEWSARVKRAFPRGFSTSHKGARPVLEKAGALWVGKPKCERRRAEQAQQQKLEARPLNQRTARAYDPAIRRDLHDIFDRTYDLVDHWSSKGPDYFESRPVEREAAVKQYTAMRAPIKSRIAQRDLNHREEIGLKGAQRPFAHGRHEGQAHHSRAVATRLR